MSKASLQRHLAQVTRNHLGRFVEIKRLKSCAGECELEPGDSDDWRESVRAYDAFLGDLEGYILNLDPDETAAAAQLVRDVRVAIRDDWGTLEQHARRDDAARLRDEYGEAEPHRHRFITTNEVDVLDLTGLEGREASTLALRLKAWNPGVTRVYSRREGRRYLAGEVRTVDLEDPTLKGLGSYDDLEALVRERRVPVRYELKAA